jgi:hypothetical protein
MGLDGKSFSPCVEIDQFGGLTVRDWGKNKRVLTMLTMDDIRCIE